MAKPILIANWKNHPDSLKEAKNLLKQLSRDRSLYKKLFFFVAPPSPYLESVAFYKDFIRTASQDISSVPKGTYTGVVTSDILKSFGVRIAILGHSERRALGETSSEVAEKVKVALRSGIAPLVCIGETVRDADGEHFEFLREQLKLSLSCLTCKADASKLVVAYEPVWAIGKDAKNAIDSKDLSQTVIFIKKVLSDLFGREIADRIPILYGGSVEVSNADVLLQGTKIRGFLVGHASLNTENLKSIAKSLISK